MDQGISDIVLNLIDKGLLSKNHILIIFAIVILYIVKKYILTSAQTKDEKEDTSESNVTYHRNVLLEHEMKINSCIDKLNSIHADIKTMSNDLHNISKFHETNQHNIKQEIINLQHRLEFFKYNDKG